MLVPGIITFCKPDVAREKAITRLSVLIEGRSIVDVTVWGQQLNVKPQTPCELDLTFHKDGFTNVADFNLETVDGQKVVRV